MAERGPAALERPNGPCGPDHVRPGDAARPFLNWWPMYRVGELVFVQERWLIEPPAGWTWSDPWSHVPAHERLNEDGDRLSEWTVPVELVLRGQAGRGST